MKQIPGVILVSTGRATESEGKGGVELARDMRATLVRDLGLGVTSLRSHMGGILLRIGIKMESICVQGFRGTVKKRYGFLPQRCRATVGCGW